MRRSATTLLSITALLLALWVPRSARAQHPPPSPPLNTVGTAIPVDGVRPVAIPGFLRSLRAPVAVHLGPGVPPSMALAVLATAERTVDAMEYGLGLPLPAPDGTRGGSPDLDIYVTTDGPTVETTVDALDIASLWDAASAFVRVRAVTSPGALARAVTEGIAQATVLGVNADPPPSVVRALGAAIATAAVDLPADPAAVRAFAREPWRGVFATRGLDGDRGAGLVLDHILRRWDDSRHRMLADLVWGAVQHTPSDAPRLWDEPDIFDVFRRLFRTELGGLPAMLLDTAVDRSVAGTPGSDDRLGDLDDPTYRAHPFRSLHWRDLPAWAASPDPLEALGMAVVDVDLADAPLGAGATVWLHGAAHTRWIASVVRLGRGGRVAARADSPVITDGTWSVDAESLDGVTHLLVVAVDLGLEDYEVDYPAAPDGFLAVHIAPAR